MSEDEDRADRVNRVKRAGGSGGTLLDGLFSKVGSKQLTRLVDGKVAFGELKVTTPNGNELAFKGAEGGPVAQIVVHNWRVLRHMMREGGVGAARAFIEGDWTSPDLPGVTAFFTKNRQAMANAMTGGGLAKLRNGLRHMLRANTHGGAKRNIAFHYDLGNDFYAEWLDPSMTYSSAVFEPGDNSLEVAQQRKYRRLLDMLEVAPGDHILEIGCGWGGFAELAARERGAKVTGLTLSEEQLSYARARIAKAGLAERVDLKLQDYRDEKGEYDHVASIEMFEAVGERYWPTFFKKVHDVLKPGGRAALQVITIEEAVFESYRRSADFIQTYIFPGGMLPSMRAFRDVAGRAGLQPLRENFYGSHYARTLEAWRRDFLRAWEEKRLPAGFDETFKRIWEYYLAYCEGGFRAGGIDVVQVSLARR